MKLSIIAYLQANKSAPSSTICGITGYPTKTAAMDAYAQASGNNWVFARRHEPWAAYSTDETPIHLDLDMPVSQPSVKHAIHCEYHSTCSKWGDYSPHIHSTIQRITEKNGIPHMAIDDKTLCAGSSLNLGDAQRRTVADGVDQLFYRHGQRIIHVAYLASQGKTSAHAPSIKAARKALKLKIETRRQQSRVNRVAARGKPITIQSLINKFGWCSMGINDFLDQCLPDHATRYSADQLLAELKTADLTYGRKHCRPELAELFCFLRAA